jgi:hypothetical protein
MLPLPAPSALFLAGAPSPELENVANAILSARPGLLFLCVHG